MKKISLKKTLLAGIITENPVFVSLLGMCATLATTKSIEAAFGMGIMVLLVLIGSNVLISLDLSTSSFSFLNFSYSFNASEFSFI